MDELSWSEADEAVWEEVRERFRELYGRHMTDDDLLRIARLEVERWLLERVREGEYEFAGVGADGQMTYRRRSGSESSST